MENVKPTQRINLSEFLILKGRKHDDGYEYGDTLVHEYRLGLSGAVEQAGKGLGLNLQNTAKEQNGRDYIGNINHEQALKLNLSLGGQTLSIRQFADFLNLLKSGIAYDGNGNKVDSSELQNILNEITQVRKPWRSEWLDGDFRTDKKGVISIHTSHILDASGNLTPQYKRELTDFLAEDRLPGIDLNEWLRNANKFGLPKQGIKQGDLYYWAPDKDNNSVAGFNANSDRANLGCYWDRAIADASLGVRHALPRAKILAA